MARVLGYVSPESSARASELVGAMASRVGSSAAEPLVATSGRGALAVVDGGSIATVGEVVAVVDGAFLNAADLPGGREATPAAQFVALYRAHGMAGALERVEGDFAVVLHDASTGELWLGRDRVGVRPLFYWRDGGRFAAASRLAGLFAVPGVSRRVNARWVAVFAGSHYRYIDNAPEETPFADLRQVPAGTAVRLSASGVETHRYWTLADRGMFDEREEVLAERYRALLVDAVGKRVAVADRPGFTLSGGMDSSSVLAAAVSLLGPGQHALSTVYSDKTYDESEDIRDFIDATGVKWHPINVEGFDLFDTVRRMVRAHDEPVATATWLSHFLLCERASADGFGTIFGGLGGDELNAGEYEYFVFHFADLRAAGEGEALSAEIAEWARHHDHPIHRKNPEVAARLLSALTDPAVPGRIRVERTRFTRYFETVSRDFHDLSTFEPVLDHPFATCLQNRTFQDLFRETAPCCLRAEDRNSSAFGLSHMDPFLDHRLIEFMFRVPGSMKIRDGVTKRLLRTATRGLLPEVTRTRIKKTGWNAPAHLWFTGTNLERLEDLVRSRGFRERGVYDPDAVMRVIAEHREIVASGANRENHMMFLWQLLNLDTWMQEVVAG